MRIDKSPFKCPYPMWVVFVVQYLSVCLPGAILLLQVGGQDGGSFRIGFFWLLAIGVAYRLLLPLQLVLAVGSVGMAFQDNPVFGWGCVIFVIPLLIPDYHTLALKTCFALQERKKLRSLVGQEGMVTEWLSSYGGIVEIDGEEFDARFLRKDGEPFGPSIIVKRARWIYLDVKMKPLIGQQTLQE